MCIEEQHKPWRLPKGKHYPDELRFGKLRDFILRYRQTHPGFGAVRMLPAITKFCEQEGIPVPTKDLVNRILRSLKESHELPKEEQRVRIIRTDVRLVAAIISIKRAHPDWGGRRILRKLRQMPSLRGVRLPCGPSKVNELLKRHYEPDTPSFYDMHNASYPPQTPPTIPPGGGDKIHHVANGCSVAVVTATVEEPEGSGNGVRCRNRFSVRHRIRGSGTSYWREVRDAYESVLGIVPSASEVRSCLRAWRLARVVKGKAASELIALWKRLRTAAAASRRQFITLRWVLYRMVLGVKKVASSYFHEVREAYRRVTGQVPEASEVRSCLRAWRMLRNGFDGLPGLSADEIERRWALLIERADPRRRVYVTLRWSLHYIIAAIRRTNQKIQEWLERDRRRGWSPVLAEPFPAKNGQEGAIMPSKKREWDAVPNEKYDRHGVWKSIGTTKEEYEEWCKQWSREHAPKPVQEGQEVQEVQEQSSLDLSGESSTSTASAPQREPEGLTQLREFFRKHGFHKKHGLHKPDSGSREITPIKDILPQAVSAASSQSTRDELREELRKELVAELKQELREELREELRKELRAELEQELREEMRKELRKEKQEEQERVRDTFEETDTSWDWI